jgi:hypothetical protein
VAFRIHQSVVRGEIDNRVKGIVRGKILLAGWDRPITLELEGNACPDMAGCLLNFTNPLKLVPFPQIRSLNCLQRGGIGDLTASRKVRVFDVPLEEAMAMFDRKEKPPEHMANCLYLEWFSDANGRVVIESTDYELTVSAPEWQLTADEEAERATQAGEGMITFMKKLSEAVEAHIREQKDPEQPWDEQDYEKFLRACDARTAKDLELLDKYGTSEESAAKIAEDEDEEDQMSAAEMNELCESLANEPSPEPAPQTEGIDWIRNAEGEVRHPLQQRCAENAQQFWRFARKAGLDPSSDGDLEKFLTEFHITSAKLEGALNGLARGETYTEPAFTVAYLKRALGHLHQAQSGLEAIVPKKLLPQEMVAEARRELFEIREGILRLMDRYRGR